MKIIDSNTIHQETIHSDICIIGAGPAGITLASKLADSNLNVMVVESGGEKFSEEVNQLNTLKVDSNFIYRNKESRRNRQIGGTANLWVGRVVPVSFDPDLDAEWGRLKDAVLPYYDEAFRFFGIEPEYARKHMKSEDELVVYWAHKTERFNTASEITKQHKNIRIYQYLTCVGNPEFNNDRIDTLTFVNQKQERTTIQSHCFVFAMGAIENTRMLLVIREQIQQNRNLSLKNAGKFVMDHPRIWHGTIQNNSHSSDMNRYELHSNAHFISKIGIRNQPGRTRVYSNVMKSVNRTTVLLNKITIPSFQVSSKRLILREKGLLRMLANEMVRVPFIQKNRFINKSLQDFFNHDLSEKYHVMTYCEQRPRHANQIILSDEKDKNGLPIPSLINNIHEDERNEVAIFFEFLRERISGMGAVLDYNKDYLLDAANFTDASHIMGGTRYSNQKAEAVLDDDLSVTGIPNLFMAGSSVFPTSGVENPTHLIVSLSCYLADVLKRKIK